MKLYLYHRHQDVNQEGHQSNEYHLQKKMQIINNNK